MEDSIYTKYHIINYNDKQYQFQPYINLWAEIFHNGKLGSYAPDDLQKKLNSIVFDTEKLPEIDDKDALNIAKKQFQKKVDFPISDYTVAHEITYKKKTYLFNPNAFGSGYWAEKTSTGKFGKYAPKEIQEILNKLVFNKSKLPSLLDRFKTASGAEKIRQIKIATGWLQLKVKALQLKTNLPGTITTQNKNFLVGGMYFFCYDAKTKEKLPFWDAFPLIILLETYSNGFLGINLHYLEPNLRIIFLSKLLTNLGSYSQQNEKIRLKANYMTLKEAGTYKEFIPCIKRYLTTHLRSRILTVEDYEWVHAAYLPVDKFQKQKNTMVWKESEKMIGRK